MNEDTPVIVASAANKPNGKKVNFRTLFTPRGNGIDVVVPVKSIKTISERFANTAYSFFLGKRVAYPVVANYFFGWSSYARAMIELRVDVELKDNIVAAMPKIAKEGYYTWNKNKNVESTNEVSKSNSSDALNLVDNDVELGTYGGSTHLASQEANSSGSSFWNAESSSPSTTPLMEKINKMESLIINGKAILVDNEGKLLRKVDEDSEDEVASVDNDIANFLAKNDGYGTQSLLEKWKDSHELDAYEYDPYDDDLYEGQEIPETLQAFCDRLDIKVRGRKKK
nr:hypothetical protein [Tanacetum cinerariifolium]